MRTQAGLTLIELMIAMAAGLVLLAGAGLMLDQARRTYDALDHSSRMHASARLALSHLGQTLAQAGHWPHDSKEATSGEQAALRGTAGNPDGSDGGDQFTVRFTGAGAGEALLRNCAGTHLGTDTVSVSRYFVNRRFARLMCQHHATGANNSATSALLEDVQHMRLIYGVDSDGDGRADQWLAARAMQEALWRRVRLVRIQLTMRDGPQTREFVGTAWLRNLPPPALESAG